MIRRIIHSSRPAIPNRPAAPNRLCFSTLSVPQQIERIKAANPSPLYNLTPRII